MALSTFTGITLIGERSEATPGLWNTIFSTISANLDTLNSDKSVLAASIGTTTSIVGFSSNTLRPETSNNTITVVPASGGVRGAVVLQSFDSGGAFFNAKAFGVAGDGVTNDTVSIQSLLNSVSSAGGGVVYLPAGTYLISNRYSVKSSMCLGLPDNVILQGAGWRTTQLKLANSINTECYMLCNIGAANGFNGAARMNSNIGVRDLDLNGNAANQVQPAASGMRGITFWPCQNSFIERVYIHDFITAPLTERFGVYISGDDTGSTTNFNRADCWVVDSVVSNCATGFGVQNTAGVRFSNCHAQSNHTFQGYTVSAAGSGVTSYDVTFTNCTARNNQNGFEVETCRISIVGCHSEANDWVGIRITGGATASTVIGNICQNNGQGGGTLEKSAGISLDSTAGAPVHNLLVGNRCFDSQTVPTQAYGLYADSTSSSNLVCANNFLGNKTSNISDGGTNIRLGNLGDGTATQLETGTLAAPTYAFASERSLGLYRSGASTLDVSYGTFRVSDYLGFSASGANLPNSTAALYNQSGVGPTISGNAFDVRIMNPPVSALSVVGGEGTTLPIIQGTKFGVLSGTALSPRYAFISELSLGLWRSGASTLALSYGTLNLADQAVRLSMRTIAASLLTASAANTNVAINETVFTVQASGASFVINSGGTSWIFNSVASAKNT